MGKYFNIRDFLGKKLLQTTALISAIAAPQDVALANPEGGVATSGSANIVQSGQNTTIHQSTNRAVIRWDSFNLGGSESVDFIQPSSNSITINRIRDNNPSQIDGSIGANGKIILINPNGIVFGASSKVDVGALVATTSDIDDDNAFMSGGAVKFTRPGKYDASIINNGLITVKQAGLVGLVAPNVENNGIIRAKLGRVQLASGDISTIDLAGDGLIKLEVSDQVRSQSVKNTGTIEADGGDVLITAAQARNAVDALITHSGRITANSIGGSKGHVTFSTKGLDNTGDRGLGTIMVSGTISTSGLNVGEEGGSITFASDRIAFTDDARAIADGLSGGGTILVGGNFHGAAGMATASQVYIGKNALLSASAIDDGKGGSIALWSDDRTQFFGSAFAHGGVNGGDGGFIEVSSESHLDFDGVINLLASTANKIGTLLLDPTDITITAGIDNNVNGATPFAPNLDDGPSNLNITTLTTALAGGNVVVQTRATGSQAGDITVGTAIAWGSGSTLTLNADHDIIVNGTISGQNLSLIAGNDVQLNSDISGSGNLSIQSSNAASAIGLGTAQAGALNLNNAELAHILNGWNNITVGSAAQTGAINIGANTWNDNLTLQTGTGAINFNGATTMGSNDLTATTAGGGITVGNTINQSSGTTTLTTAGAGTISINSGITKTSGALNVNTAGGAISTSTALSLGTSNLSMISSGGNITVGNTISQSTGTMSFNSGAGALGIGGAITKTSGTINLNTTSGVISVSAALNAGSSALNITTDANPAITAALTGTGNLNITQASVGTSMGLGNAQAGTVNLDTTEIGFITNGWNNLTFGRTDGTAAINVGALTWNDFVTLQTGTGAINLNGALTMSSNDLIATTNGGGITVGSTIGQSSGNLNLTTTGAGAININGAVTKTSGAMNLTTAGGAIATTAGLNIGSTNLSVASFGGNITLGNTLSQTTGTMAFNSGAGQLNLNGAITKTSGTINLNSTTGVITIGAALGAGSSALNITTDANIALNNTLTGSGTLTVAQASVGTTMGLGNAQAGTVNLDTTEIGNIVNGWGNLIFGRTDGTGTMNVGALTWNDFLTLQTGSGAINLNGALTMSSNDLTATTNGGGITVGSTIGQSSGNLNLTTTGAGAININGAITKTSGALNLTTAGGAIATTAALSAGAANLTVGSSGGNISLGSIVSQSTGTIAVNSGAGALTISGGITKTSGTINLNTTTGVLTVSTVALNAGSSALNITTDANPVISAAITGTGTLTVAQNSAGTTMGLGAAQAGAVNLDASELGFLTNGWTNLVFGRTDGTGAINIGTSTWNDFLTVQSSTGTININGAQTMGANNLTLSTNGGAINVGGTLTQTSGIMNISSGAGVITVNSAIGVGSGNLNITTDANPIIAAALSGAGNLTIAGATASTTMGFGAAQVGTLNMDATELGNIANGWTNIILGRTDGTGAMNVGANTWNDNLTLQSSTGAINLNGATVMGSNDLTVTTLGGVLTVTGTISQSTGTIAMNTGTGALNLNGGITKTSGTVNLNTTTGVISVGAAQNFGSSAVNITTDANPVITAALTGTGTLTLAQTSVGTTMGLGNAQAGTVNLDATEIGFITNGWANLIFGRTNGTGVMNVGANTWNDFLTLQSGTGAINFTGAQTLNANNLTVTTQNGAINVGGTLTQTSGTMALSSGTGVITVSNAINVGSGNLNITTDGNPVITAALTGTGNLTISNATTAGTLGLGGGAGGLNIDATELTNITNGWTNIIMGRTDGTGAMNVAGTNTWNDNLTLQNGTGAITIAGAQTMGANNLTVTTVGGTQTVTGTISQSTGTLAFDSGTGGMNLNGAITKTSGTVNLNSTTGIISIGAILNAGSSATNITTDGNLALAVANALTGTGTLTVSQASAGTTMGLGGGAGTVNLTAAEINNIKTGWASLIFGRTDGTATMAVGTATWTSPVTLRNGSGAINITGAQTLAANNMAITTTTGAITTSSTIGGTTGNLSMTTAGGAITIGGIITKTGGTTSLNSGTGLMTINSALNVGGSNLNLTADNDVVIGVSGALTGTSTLTITSNLATTGIGLGNAQTGLLNLDTAEVGRITNGWTSLIFGNTTNTADINVGALTWNDSLTLRDGAGNVNINGAQAMNANTLTTTTTSGTITSTAAGTITGSTGAFAFTTTSGNINLGGTVTETTGNVTLTSAGGAIATTAAINGTTGTTTMTSGGGAITVGGNITRAGGTVNLTGGTGLITINNAIAVGTGGGMTISTDNDLVLGASGILSGTGTLTILPALAATSVGLGTGQAGTLNLTDAELNNISNGWNSLVFGNTGTSGALNVGAYTWQDNVTVRTGTGALNINGTQTMSTNNFVASTTTGAITSTGTITGTTGTTQLTTTGGAITVSGDITRVGGTATLTSGTGLMTINNPIAVGMNGNTNITTDNDLVLGAGGILSGTGTLTITPGATGTSVGLGTGQAGTLNLNDTELSQLADGWSSMIFGNASSTAAMNVKARAWTDPLTLRTGSGLMTIAAGATTLAGNNLTISTDSNLALNGTIAGGGSLTIQPSAVGTSMGIGTGQAGTLQLSNAELDNILDGWGVIFMGNTAMTGAMNVGAYTWRDNLDLRTLTGAMNINGTMTMDSNGLALHTNSNLALAVGANLTGTNTLTIASANNTQTIGIGTGQAGVLSLTDTELGQITDGWANIIIGSTAQTGAITVGAETWNDPVQFISNTGVITIAGAQTMGANNLTIATDANPVINASLSGSGKLFIQGAANGTVINLANGVTTGLSLDNIELGQLLAGWNEIVFGTNTNTGGISVGANTWQYNTRFVTNTGVITVAGAQNAGGNDFTFETNANLTINSGATLSGRGNLTIMTASPATTMSVGTTGGALAVDAAELARIQDGWGNLYFGNNTMTGTMNVAAYAGWNDNVKFTTGSGVITAAAQNVGANNLTYETNGDLSLTGNQTGTGNLTIEGASLATIIGVGAGQAGSLQLSTTDLGKIVSGWSGVQIGRQDSTAQINVGTNTWANKTTFITRGNIVLNGTTTSSLGAGTNLVFATGGAFTNNVGAGAINAGGGRYLVYSVAPGSNTLNGLTPTNTVNNQTYFSYAPGSVTETGNVYIYSNGSVKILYIQADNKVKVYGDAVPTLTYTYMGGLQGGDTLSAALLGASLGATGALVTDNVGVTRVITGTFTTALGYTVQLTDGTLSVTKAPLLVQPNSATRIYGDADPAFSLVYTGFKNGETSAVIDTLPTASTTTTGTTAVSAVNAITPSGGIDNNYTFNYATNNMTITKAPLVATAQDATREYGLANPGFSIVYTGFKNGETASVIGTPGTASTTAVIGSNVGSYAITPSGAVDTNYSFTYVNGNLSVTPATITVSADNKSRNYGDADPAFTATLGGFRNGDTSAVISSLVLTPTSTITSNVGTYAINGSGATATNYVFSYTPGTLTINQAMLTATAQNATREYGDANPILSVVYTGFKNGEDQSVIDALAGVSTTAVSTTDVGSVAITASGAADGNYAFTYVDGTLSITKVILTATVQNATREYGDANPAFSIVYTGFKNSETNAVIDTLATPSTGAIATTDVGSYLISAAGAADGNYDFFYVGGSLAITQAHLTATTQNATREYGDANPALNVVYTGFKNGETASVIDTAAIASTVAVPTTDVGSYAVTSTGAVDNNYDFTYVDSGNLTITQAMLTATVQNQTREYGDANPSLSIVYTGFKNGETSAVIDTLATATTVANNTTDAGAYTNILTASGAVDGNYSFAYNFGDLTITKATVTATTQNATRLYGDADPTLNIVYTGFKNGETSAVIDTLATPISGTIGTTNVGSYAITSSGATDNNYNFVYADTGNLTITQAHLTATTQDASREYGDADPTFSVVYTGFKNGETSAVIDTLAVASSTANNVTNVGVYTDAITSTGASDGNYDFTYANTGDLTITQAMLTATTQNATREYGDANPSLSVVYTGFKNGETAAVIDTLATPSTTAVPTTNVGSYAITSTGAADGNYAFTYANTGNLTITQATLTATVQNITRDYGDANPPLSIVYTGFKNGENDSVIDTAATTATTTDNFTNAGTYSNILTASGAADTNYAFVYDFGDLTVNKVNVTATTQSDTREYGDANPILTAVYTGFKNGETSAVIDTLASINTTATPTSNVGGGYAITASGASDNNYNILYANTGNLTITQAHLTVTTQNTTRQYGDVNPSLSVVYTGFKNGETSAVIDTLAGISTAATPTTNVGSYAITASGATDSNYDFTYANTGNLTITQAHLTATAQNATREYGDTNPGFTVVYTGFKNGETSAVIDTLAGVSTTATPTSNVGNGYAITASGAVDGNYDFAYVDGSLSITKATVTATVQNATREYGDANPIFAVVYTGFKNGENDGVIDTLATPNTTATAMTNTGSYSIAASGAIDGNYNFTYVNGSLSITKATLTATVQNATREYGDANPNFAIVYTGFKNGETSAVIDTLGHGTSVNNLANVGSYTITGSGAVDNNYNFTYVDGNMTISKATLTAVAHSYVREQGQDNPLVLAISYTGFKNGENESVIDTPATAATLSDGSSIVGDYAITPSGAADDNYDFSYVDGVMRVVPIGSLNPPIVTIPSTVETTVKNVTTQHIVTSNMFKELLPLWHAGGPGTMIAYDDIFIIPDRDLYQFDYSNMNFLIAVTDQLKQRFLLGYAEE